MKTSLDNFFGRPIGIFDFVYKGTPAEQAKAIKQAGFSSVQWGLPHDTLFELSDKEIEQDYIQPYKDQGLDLVVISGYQNIVDPVPEKKQRAKKLLKRLIEIAPMVGKGLGIATETGTKNPESQWIGHPDNLKQASWDEMVTVVKDLITACEANDSYLFIEGYVENIVRTADDILRLKAEVQSDRLGFIMDPFNLYLEERKDSQPEENQKIFEAIGKQTKIAHAKDLLFTNGVISTPTAGDGIFDYIDYFKRLDEQHPSIPLILEHLEMEKVPQTIEYLKREYDRYKSLKV